MRTIKYLSLLILFTLFAYAAYSQAPSGIKYQSVIRNSSGEPITNKLINIQLSITDNSPSGSLLYQESHISQTNNFGLVNLVIGEGSGPYDFNSIDWANGNEKWLTIAIDTTGGNNYTEMGSSRLFSVPYALYSENSGSQSNFWSAGPNGIFYQNGNVGIGTNSPSNKAALDISSDDKGFLPPRMTESQRDAINNPPAGLMIFNNDSKCINIYKNGAWYEICGTCMPPPQADLSSNSPACIDGEIHLYANNTGGAQCHWSGPDGFTSNATNPLISNADSSNAGYYSLYTSNQCGNTSPDSIYVSIQPLPQSCGTVSGQNNVCRGDTAITYSVSPVNFADSYIWTLPANSVINGNSDSCVISVNYTDSAISGNITVTPHNSCGDGASSAPLYVNVDPLPTVANAGSDQLNIQGDSTSLSANSPNYGTGSWSIGSGTGGNILNPSQANTPFTGTQGNSYILVWEISNSCGSSSDSVEISFAPPFTCGDSLIDYRDGQKYATVQIGSQCWLAENMNLGQKINSSSNQTDNGTIEKYCYNNNDANCDTYGGLYQWREMLQLPDSCESSQCQNIVGSNHQGICPAGWHVPTDDEYKTLEMQLGMTQAEADMANTWRGDPVGTKLKDGGSSGFDALLSGRLQPSGFTLLNSYEYPYTASEYGAGMAWRRCLSSASQQVGRWNTFPKDYAFSVRCVKND